METNDNYVLVASDHNGNAARIYICKLLKKMGRNFIDLNVLGDLEQAKVDYPDVVRVLCNGIKNSPGDVGILVCGTGTGMCIAANRFSHIRAALVTDRATAELSKEHNNANVLVLGQWRNPLGQMDEIVSSWLETPFGEGRHVARLKKLERILD